MVERERTLQHTRAILQGYRVFGRSETCLMPPPDHAHRFLD
jgi:predicted DCC family thiol-disulfide oxidoreductase YuxK